MAALDFGERDLYAGVTEDFPFSVYVFESDGETAAALSGLDVVHCVLSSKSTSKTEPTGVLLDIASDEATANGSRVILTSTGNANTGNPAAGYVRFAQADTAALIADWEDSELSKRLMCEVYYLDASDEVDSEDARKLFLRGIIHLHRSGASV